MNPINRAIAVLSQPRPAMSAAAGEPATTGSLIGGYAAILALLPAIGALLALVLFAGAALGYIIGSMLVLLVLVYALRDLGLTILMGVIINALAPAMGGRKDGVGALKLAVYAATAIWVASFLYALLAPLGAIAYLVLLAGFGFAGFLLYLGCGPILGVPQAQAAAFAGATTVIWLVLYIVVEQLLQQIFLRMLIGGAMRSYGM